MKRYLIYYLTIVYSISFWSCQPSLQRPNVYLITDFGASKDTTVAQTKYIQLAIDEAFHSGGGCVIIPPGVYVTGTLKLKSNVTLEVLAGAELRGSSDLADYTPMLWGHNVDRQPYHLILADSAENIEIRGQGVINGNGPAFWEPHNPANNPQWIKAKQKKVSPMVEIHACKNVIIKDITLKTGGGWTLHLFNSDAITISGAKILNHLFSPNGDGIDISGCFDVAIQNCIIKTCDDAICLKTMGDTRECKRITVTNCIIECSCAALKIGNESFRNISQVTFSNCVVYNSSRAIGLYAEGGGTVEDVIISNIVCDSKTPLLYNRPIHISLLERKEKGGGIYGSMNLNDSSVFDNKGRQPKLRNILISNIIAKSEGRILITAEPGRMIENLTLRDIQMIYPFIEDPEPNVDKIKSAQFSPMNPDAKKARAAMVVENVKNLVVDNFSIQWPTDSIPEDWKFPVRIANGTFDTFQSDYSKIRPCEFHAMWLKNVQGGYIDAPMAFPSSGNMKKVESIGSQITIK